MNKQDIEKYRQIILNEYFSEIGAMGGRVKSDRKTIACRENGKKGGRPKKNRRPNLLAPRPTIL